MPPTRLRGLLVVGLIQLLLGPTALVRLVILLSKSLQSLSTDGLEPGVRPSGQVKGWESGWTP